jgi:hypothetical protein
VRPLAPPVRRDATGCMHVPAEVFGLWQCRLCTRRLDEVFIDGRVMLKARLPLLPPDGERNA